MTIEFACQCGKVYRVHEEDAGKKAKCKECGAQMVVPPVEAAVEDNWWVSSQDGNQYGPVAKSQIDQWVNQGLITPRCQLFRDGDADWKPATHYYPKLIPPYRPLLTPLPKKNSFSDVMIGQEIKRMQQGMQITCGKRFRVGEEQTFWEQLKANTMVGPVPIQTRKIRITELEEFRLRDASGEFVLLAPSDQGNFAPIQYIALMKGRLPAPIVLLKNASDNSALEAAALAGGALGFLLEQLDQQPGGIWAGCQGDMPAFAEAAQQIPPLTVGMRWEGSLGGLGSVTTIYRIRWGAQAIPVNDESYLLIGQTVPQLKLAGFTTHIAYNIGWFAEFRRQFAYFVSQNEATTTGSFEVFDPGVWLATCIESLGWVKWKK